MRRWELGGAPFAVSVNVSAHQLLDADFVPTVQAVLEDTGLSPDRLILEVTETVLLKDRAAATRRLGELRVMAVRIALDDFGAGYSSLSYLNDLPLDVVKLDRSFTAMLTGLSPRRKLVLAIVRMLDTLDVQTVCEGVETAEQLDYVTALGMDSVQGYHLCRPVPADDLIEAIADIETAGRAHTAA
jgi:EAL domain-containing protein (putative c-di-GMP-specific phosphodiesterase class I)